MIKWFLILMCLFMQAHADDRAQTEEVGFTFGPPVQVATWEHPPVVRICRGAPVTETRVEKQLTIGKN